ncbi:pheA operon leader peptide PheL [Klebsiella pneumoniae]|nr:pheA operon leader peptide PheL [Klebsiella pneumoniae]
MKLVPFFFAFFFTFA